MRKIIEDTTTSFEKLTEDQFNRGLTKLEGNNEVPREFGERTDDRGRYIMFFNNVKDQVFIGDFEAILNG